MLSMNGSACFGTLYNTDCRSGLGGQTSGRLFFKFVLRCSSDMKRIVEECPMDGYCATYSSILPALLLSRAGYAFLHVNGVLCFAALRGRGGFESRPLLSCVPSMFGNLEVKVLYTT